MYNIFATNITRQRGARVKYSRGHSSAAAEAKVVDEEEHSNRDRTLNKSEREGKMRKIKWKGRGGGVEELRSFPSGHQQFYAGLRSVSNAIVLLAKVVLCCCRRRRTF